MADDLLKVRVISPKEDIFVGVAKSVSSRNLSGPFDILSRHAKFVTLVQGDPLVIRLPDGQRKEFHFNLAIVHAHDNQVNIYSNPLEAGQDLTKVS